MSLPRRPPGTGLDQNRLTNPGQNCVFRSERVPNLGWVWFDDGRVYPFGL